MCSLPLCKRALQMPFSIVLHDICALFLLYGRLQKSTDSIRLG
ncbi:hypothetical protein QSI_2292 [Clostridioides difficile P28]|nr:hypothetical protein QSI_2292 [Clostridioides difficile P28]